MSPPDNDRQGSIVLATQNSESEHPTQTTPTHAAMQVVDLLFNGVVFYVNPFLGAPRIAQLEEQLFKHGALKTPHSKLQDDSDWQSNTLKTTHIITEDYDFADYKHASARGIHIVTLPAYDRQVISEAVQDYGGSFERDINKNVTHLIALTTNGDKYSYVMEHPELEIKVVLPHWFQVCCNLKRRFPEDDNFEVQQDAIQTGAPQLFSNSVKTVATFLNTPNPSGPQFLRGLNIIMARDLHIVPELKRRFIERIEEAGGSVANEDDYSSDMIDIVICRFRIGALYTQAARDGKTVASADWLLHVLQTGTLPSPKASLLHYPIPNDPIAGMTEFVMTISNYTGPIREYLKRMIVAVGAVYKPTMSSRAAPEPTTHIICGNASGEKYEKGQEWNVKVVNHLWLEDCFQSWVLQSEAKPRYTLFPVHNQLSQVFGTKINPQEIDDWVEELAEKDLVKAEPEPEPEFAPIVPAETGPAEPDQPENHANLDKQIQGGDDGRPVKIQPESPKKPTLQKHRMTTIDNDKTSSPPSKAAQSSTKSSKATEKDASPAPSTSAPGSVLVYSRQRGAALKASKALEQNAADMNTYQEERQNEKKALKKRKRVLLDDVSVSKDGDDDDEGDESENDMDIDRSTPSKKPASPTKKRRATRRGSTSGTPARSDDEEDNTLANSSREAISIDSPKAPSKRKRTLVSAVAIKEPSDSSMSPPVEESKAPKESKESKDSRTVKYLRTGITEHATRTEKFLSGIAQAKFVVRKEYLNACIDANEVLNENDYRLADPEGKQEYDVRLYEALDRAKSKKVFENCLIYISPSTQPKPAQLKPLVEIGGGKAVFLKRVDLKFLKEKIKASQPPKTKDDEASTSEDDDGTKEETIVVVSCEEDMEMWKQLQEVGARVYSKELILQGLLLQQLDLGDTTNEPKLFKVPTPEEMEERRRKFESEKPALFFKPKMLEFATNATKPATAHSSASSPTPATRTPLIPNDSSQAPAIVNSRQFYEYQQKQQQTPLPQQQQPAQLRRASITKRPKTASSAQDDEFGFDDLDDIDFHDDDFLNLEDDASKPANVSQTASSSSSATSSADATPTAGINSATATTSTAAPATPAFIPKSKSTIVVRASQRGNPLLQFIRNVPYEYGDIVPDYAVGLTSCILFLSIRYHRLHPEYIFNRIADLGKSYVLRVILILVDVDSHQQAIRELTRVGMANDLTVICAWSNEEAARYIETFKAYEYKAPDAIKERIENDYLSKLTDALTQIQSINKTDVVTLSSTFGSLKNIMDASVDELGLLPGFGERKVKRLLEAFDQPFAIDPKKRRHRSKK
ncbi:ssDNA endonuclease and repair protein rad10 [Podila epicladia]|nr:ssDNA endonuclease and repair protein rad10 [Podila epicladia]